MTHCKIISNLRLGLNTTQAAVLVSRQATCRQQWDNVEMLKGIPAYYIKPIH